VGTCAQPFHYSKTTILYISTSFTSVFILDELILHSSLPNIHENRDSLIKTGSSSTTISSHLSHVTDKLDSNIALAQTLLNMLDSLNSYNNNNSSTMKIDLLHMYIRQFLIEFDARIRRDRKRRKNCKKPKKVIG
jgi:hypothetical protein